MASGVLVPVPGVYHTEHHGAKTGRIWFTQIRTCLNCDVPMDQIRPGHFQCPDCGATDIYMPQPCPDCHLYMRYDEREVHSCPACGITELHTTTPLKIKHSRGSRTLRSYGKRLHRQ
jgi:predicted RNA-binding Zn-ribbon protein involved in translation (DUF1610 family)